MPLVLSHLSEGCLAHSARERLFPSVSACMCLQVELGGRGVRAMVASEHFLLHGPIPGSGSLLPT